MATVEKRLATNVDGDFYVDETCIDCATCRWMAPETFDRDGDKSRVHGQPDSQESAERALRALLACPTASIGTVSKHDMGPILKSIPTLIDRNVYHSGYHSESSFGAASYFIQRPEGNILIDSPRFTKALAKRLEERGGVEWMLLTHCDDVADHQKFHDHFGCKRVMHLDDIRGSTKNVEVKVEGTDRVEVTKDLSLFPTPGHTKGSVCFIYDERYLFSGDHVAWSSTMEQIYAFRGACWYDWDTVKESMTRLKAMNFEWILPGHGWPCQFSPDQMKIEMQRCIDWMATV
ncbi:MAG: MBL fold metallo-hydrolase [Planctomycetota bacterium]|nr:MBL fold metallo-hydrolase [Planctomycetota bacterium]